MLAETLSPFSAARAGPQSARVLRLYDRSCCDSPAVPALRVLKPIYRALFSLSPCDLGTRLISVGSGGFQTRPLLQDKTSRRGFCRLSTGGVPTSHVFLAGVQMSQPLYWDAA